VILHPLFLLTPRFRTTQSLLRAADVSIRVSIPGCFARTKKLSGTPIEIGPVTDSLDNVHPDLSTEDYPHRIPKRFLPS
jgi:hypothetical protein